MTTAPTRPAYGWHVGTFGGIPVYIGRSWLFIALIVVATFAPQATAAGSGLALQLLVGVSYAVLLLMSVLAHEAAHAVTARFFRLRVDRVVADLMGGHTVFQAEETTPGSSAAIAVSGPIVNAAIGGLAYLGYQATEPMTPRVLLLGLAFTNLFVAVFNLLPGLPLDGGYLVDALVWKITGDRNKALVIGGWFGRVVIGLVAGWVIFQPMLHGDRPDFVTIAWVAFVGAFIWNGASQAIRVGTIRGRLVRVPASAVISAAVGARADHPIAEAVSALDRFGRPAWLVALDAAGRPIGVVDPQALSAVPASRLATTNLGSVVVAQPADWVVPVGPDADLTTLVVPMQRAQLAVVAVVTADGLLAGVATADAVNAALSAPPPR